MDYYNKYLKYKNKYLELKSKYLKNNNIEKGGFIKLLKEKNPEEYKKLFVIKNRKVNNKLFVIKNKKVNNKLGPKTKSNIILNKLIKEKRKKQIKYKNNKQIKDNNNKQIKDKNNKQIKDKNNKQNIYQDKQNKQNISSQLNGIMSGGAKAEDSWAFIIGNFYRKVRSGGLSIKISNMSNIWDEDDTDAKYAGIIFWHKNGHGEINPRRNIHSVYVIIQNTMEWSGEHFKNQGQGQVHDYLYEQVLDIGLEEDRNKACSSGFSLVYDHELGNWIIKFSSWWLNSDKSFDIRQCNNTASKMTNKGEGTIIVGAINQWMRFGIDRNVFTISYIPEEWENDEELEDDYYWCRGLPNGGEYDYDNPYTPERWDYNVGDNNCECDEDCNCDENCDEDCDCNCHVGDEDCNCDENCDEDCDCDCHNYDDIYDYDDTNDLHYVISAHGSTEGVTEKSDFYDKFTLVSYVKDYGDTMDVVCGLDLQTYISHYRYRGTEPTCYEYKHRNYSILNVNFSVGDDDQFYSGIVDSTNHGNPRTVESWDQSTDADLNYALNIIYQDIQDNYNEDEYDNVTIHILTCM